MKNEEEACGVTPQKELSPEGPENDFTENRSIYLRISTRFDVLLMLYSIASALDEWAMVVRKDGVESLRTFYYK